MYCIRALAVGVVGLVWSVKGTPAARPTPPSPREAPSEVHNVVYWGQNGGGTIENNDLASYCQPDSGIDVLVLAFLYQFGHGGNIPSGTIGQSCSISTSGQGQNCEALTRAIGACQAAGVKIILSIGGATSSYSLESRAQAEEMGQYLWDSYGRSGNATVPRPFGSLSVDGFDFDIEADGGSSQHYQHVIARLRSNFAADASNTYWITGAPQCPIPEPNMGVIIRNAAFDHLYVQFYNNNNYTVPCALGINGNAPLNYNNWTSFIAGTPSARAKIFIGVPASPLASTGTPSGAQYYATPDELAAIVDEYKGDGHFGGIMMWSAGFSDANVSNGCTYAQQARSILVSGGPCGSSGPAPTHTAPPAAAATGTDSSAASTPPTRCSLRSRCDGDSGPTRCVSP